MTNKTYKAGDQAEVKVRSWEFGKTEGKGTKYVRIRFENYIDKTLWLWSSPKATKMGFQVLETLGFKGKDLTMLKHDNALNKDKFFFVTIDEVRKKDGKSYYSASWVNDPDKLTRGFNSDLTDDELDEYSMDTSAYIEDAEDIDGPAASESTTAETNFTADDIPF